VAAGAAGHAVELDQVMIVAGVGCRRGAEAAEITAAIHAALADQGLGAGALTLIATSAAKADEPGIKAAATGLGLPLIGVPQHDMEAAGARVATRSERAIAVTGVPSLAEAAALAAAGPTARLLVARVAVGPATCALAETEEAR
jgi:cobalt-precorrin 5A hydrolase